MIHTGKEAAAGKSAVQRKIVVKYLFFKANAKLVNAFKKRPVFTIMLMVKSGKNSGKIRDFFFLRKHPNEISTPQTTISTPRFRVFSVSAKTPFSTVTDY